MYCASRAVILQVSEVLAFQVDPPATKKASKYGYFNCDLCKQITSCDSTCGGTLRPRGGERR